MQIAMNQTKGASIGGVAKVDCAKECPCGVPVIPVPDQWLEVMVTGGFKVWHIIFIIIAFVVTLIVVYCCFHRCRIPRTKQEIEADLMRMNIANKFRDYLQELPNEPTSFLEALKKVQDLEEKSEKDDAQMARDAGARKRLGWLKLKGKGDKEAAQKPTNNEEQTPDEKAPIAATTTEPELAQKITIPTEPEPVASGNSTKPPAPPPEPIPPKPPVDQYGKNGTTQVNLPENSHATGEQEPKVRQARRRKQKPNLSRTKRAKEKWNGDIESQRPPELDHDIHSPEIVSPSHLPAPTSTDAKDKLPISVDKVHKDKSTSRRPPKHHNNHHTHRVKIESKTLGQPPDV